MSTRGWLPAMAVLLLASTLVLADNRQVNCDHGESLATALEQAQPGETIQVSGTCQEAVTIITDRITLDGRGSATIDGRGAEAVTADGVRGVTLTGLTVRQGLNGIVAKGGAHLKLTSVTMQNNLVSGIRVDGHSSVELRDCTTQNNGVNGLEVDRASEVKITGTFLSQGNGVFGISLLNTSSIVFATATVTSTNNTLGIAVGLNSGASIADAATTVTTSDNLTTGFTVVSGSSLLVFEGAIVARNNRLNHGVSANSKSSIDLDRGGAITATDNGLDGVQLEDSLLNLFNMPGQRGSTVVATDNQRHGLSTFVGGKIDLSGDSQITSQRNGQAGLFADNGGSVRVSKSTLTQNGTTDVALSFGTRAEFTQTTLGTITCDATVLIRGDTGTGCPAP
jgi:parallel beta helix pectate lyase-like protein